MESTQGRNQEDRISGLDGLRALCFLQVLVGHAGWSQLVGGGGLGVTVFFSISGFVITHLLMGEASRTGHIAIGRFLSRRAFRLWPALFTYLTAAWIATPWVAPEGYGQLDALTIASLYGHFANYVSVFHEGAQAPPGAGVCWSLAVEEHFYLLYPFLMAGLLGCASNSRRLVLGLSALCLAAVGWRYVVWSGGGDWHRIYLSTDTRFDSLLYGCIAAATRRWWATWLCVGPRAFAAIILAAGLILISVCVREAWFRETIRYSVQSVAATLLIMSVTVMGRTQVCGWLDHPIMVYLGRISYEMYLVHLTVLIALGSICGIQSPALLILAGCVVSCGLATILHFSTTVPAMRLRARLLP